MCAREREREGERALKKRAYNRLEESGFCSTVLLLFEYRGNLKMNFNRIYERFVPDNEYTSTIMGF